MCGLIACNSRLSKSKSSASARVRTQTRFLFVKGNGMIKARQMRAAVLAFLAVGISLAASPIAAQEQQEPVAPKLEPDAVAALGRMGAALRNLKSFEVVSDGTLESVYENGQKLHTQARTTYLIELPNHMRVDMQSTKSSIRLVYDGKAMNVVGMKARKFVRFPMADTVGQVFGRLEDDFGITLPLRELFLWGSEMSDAEVPYAGFKVGDSMIGSMALEHYAFRNKGLDWQIWLDKSDAPLPRKLVVTRTDVPQQPQFIAHFSWNTAPKIEADAFRWTPGPDYQLVDFGTAALAEVAPPVSGSKAETKR